MLIALGLNREAKVVADLQALQALQNEGARSLQPLVPHVYNVAPAALRGVAERLLLAHLLKLKLDGWASCEGLRWMQRDADSSP